MIPVRPQDAIHKMRLLRLLTEILDDTLLSRNLYFKGGTAASMLGFLDRFSVDLDFDIKRDYPGTQIRKRLYEIFKKQDLQIITQSKSTLFFNLKYPSAARSRNSIHLSIIEDYPKSNEYKSFYLPEIDRTAYCQTIETMFANKLVALTDRYNKYKTLAGRDIYDIHHFFMKGYRYNDNVISERTGLSAKEYLQKLIGFIQKNISHTVINEDLNSLLPYDEFMKIRKTLISEIHIFLRDEIARL